MFQIWWQIIHTMKKMVFLLLLDTELFVVNNWSEDSKLISIILLVGELHQKEKVFLTTLSC